MIQNAASRAQIEAADPLTSTWLSANAGSGKTRVLTDRVARLLLNQVPPERILCLTYTKAAASEMQNRLFRRLGEWAMLDNEPLMAQLVDLGIDPTQVDPGLLSRARTLFARAIETPGGLKIQTIHSFCAAVLRRFPLEAGVSPGFTEMDERAQKRLTEDVLDMLADGPTQPAFDGIARYLSGEDAVGFVQRVLSFRNDLAAPWSKQRLFDWFGVPLGLTSQVLVDRVFQGGEREICQIILSHLDPEKRTEGANHRRLSAINWDAPGVADLINLEAAFLTGPKTKTPNSAKIGKFPNVEGRAALGDLTEDLNDLMERVEAACPERRALAAAEKTNALHRFSEVFVPAFEYAKRLRGWLDFDDLINLTQRLLSDPSVAQWVLFRLDGGIDHILVDEAQDTSPQQWQIIAQLSQEFASGAGARDGVDRTIFVVGDKKQSIYSFQGADPEGFDQMRDHFEEKLTQVSAPFQSRDLLYSFRSAPPILQLVDQVFEGEAGEGVGHDVRHIAFKSDLPGRVDIWPAIETSKDAEPGDWDDPVDLLAEDHHMVRLARRVAAAIKTILEDGTSIVSEGKRRRVQPGDILVLVQRRSQVFHEIIAAIKALNLPIAGADRMRVAAELAVKDLTALLSFLATPEDDLSLAAILRSPLFGWSEAELYDLAQPREGRFLWRELQTRTTEFPKTVETLEDLRNLADFLRPYDLLERILIRHDGWRNLLARLGPEAEDGIDAMLSQALAYERVEVPSLTGFVGWLLADDVTIKRDPGSAGNQIRVMSIHGAKGLEAPIVILPDTAQRRGGQSGPVLIRPEDGPVAWSPTKDDSPAELQPALDQRSLRETEERRRLLYVAMTRAESWLIVCAAGELGANVQGSWYGILRESVQALEPQAQVFFGEVGGLRLQTGDWSLGARDESADNGARAPLPYWAIEPAPAPVRAPEVRSPSDLGGAKALAGDTGLSEEGAKQRGRRVHALLEHLWDQTPASWRAFAPMILAAEGALTDAEFEDVFAEAAAVLSAPSMAAIFHPDALTEVSLTGHSAILQAQVMGQIDRLLVEPTRVLAVDFKSNAIVPKNSDAVPEGILRQMGAYAELLGAIYPDRRIDLAILWTNSAELMEVPHTRVMDALQRAANA
jgi:ATP-dependent helicase/nuclease subunit A